MVPRASRAYVGKCQITRNDPRLCQVIDFCILRTFYSVGDSLFSLRLPGRRISTGSGLLSHQLSSRESTGQTNEATLRFLCFFVCGQLKTNKNRWNVHKYNTSFPQVARQPPMRLNTLTSCFTSSSEVIELWDAGKVECYPSFPRKPLFNPLLGHKKLSTTLHIRRQPPTVLADEAAALCFARDGEIERDIQCHGPYNFIFQYISSFSYVFQ